MLDKIEILTLLFLMLGPFKIFGPFAKITRNASPLLTRQIAIRATLYSVIALLLAAFAGESFLTKYGIPLSILKLSAGVIFFLVALQKIIHQFAPSAAQVESKATPSLSMAMDPIAFPTIVTPYGIAAVILFFSFSNDLNSHLTIGAMILGIMLLNLVAMLVTRHVFKYLSVVLPILGAVLGVIQVALGLLIIYNSLKELINN